MKAFWYGLWVFIIWIGAVLGSAVPVDSKYITGFIVGCFAMTALRLAREDD